MALRGILPSMEISATGLSAMRRRMNAIASNIANSETTRTDDGGPYRRQEVVMREASPAPTFPARLKKTIAGLTTTHPNHLRAGRGQDTVRQAPFRGVESEINISDDEPLLVFDPDHPDANDEGYVAMPKINLVQEMVDLIIATRAYEANVTVMQVDKDMAKKALEI